MDAVALAGNTLHFGHHKVYLLVLLSIAALILCFATLDQQQVIASISALVICQELSGLGAGIYQYIILLQSFTGHRSVFHQMFLTIHFSSSLRLPHLS